MVARIRYLRDDSVTVSIPYNPAVVSALKSLVPGPARSWDPIARQWTIRSPYHSTIIRLLEQHFADDVEFVNSTTHSKPPIPIRSIDRAFATLHLLPSAPTDLIDASYKILARQAHPDTGGDGEAMRRLNEAVSVLRQRRVAS